MTDMFIAQGRNATQTLHKMAVAVSGVTDIVILDRIILHSVPTTPSDNITPIILNKITQLPYPEGFLLTPDVSAIRQPETSYPMVIYARTRQPTMMDVIV